MCMKSLVCTSTVILWLFVKTGECVIGATCDGTQGDFNNPTCSPDGYCSENVCRRAQCTADSQCQIYEQCRGSCYPKPNAGTTTDSSMKCSDGSAAIEYTANNGAKMPLGCNLNAQSSCPANSRCLADQAGGTAGKCCSTMQTQQGGTSCPADRVVQGTSCRLSTDCSSGTCVVAPNAASGVCCRIPTCPGGSQALPTQCQQNCDCPYGYVCQNIASEKFCCQGQSYEAACTSNVQCSGNQCKNGRCCSPAVTAPGLSQCSNGVAPTARCINGLCALGQTCENPGNICCNSDDCPANAVAYKMNGQTTLCSGTNPNTCPPTYSCMKSPSSNNYYCCNAVIGPSFSCPNNQQAQLTSSGQPQTCSPSLQLCNAGYSCIYNPGSNNYLCCQNTTTVALTCPNNQPVQRTVTGQAQTCSPSAPLCYSGYSCQYSVSQSTYLCCQDTTGKLGFPCISGRYCDDRSAICDQGVCKCITGYEQTIDGKYCVPLPALGQRCDGCDSFSACYKCADANAKCSCSYTGCFCACDEDKGFYNDVNKCSRSTIELDAACSKDQQCIQAYSQCTSSVCACRTGFTKDTTNSITTCKPDAMNCPFDVPFTADSKIFECTKRLVYNPIFNATVGVPPLPVPQTGNLYPCAPNQNVLDLYDDDCPENYYCNVYDSNMLASPANSQSKGFCCKMHEPKCPVGNAHTSSVAPNFGCDQCPTESHYCHDDGNTNPRQICCPRACQVSSDILVSGKCYSKSFYMGECQVEQQCADIGIDIKCVTVDAKSICACNTGFVLQFGRCVEAKCQYGSEPFKLNEAIARCGYFTPPYSPLTSSNTANAAQDCPANVYECKTDLNICCKKACPISSMTARFTASTCTSDSYCVRSLPYINAYQLRCNTDTGVCCELNYGYIPPVVQPTNALPNVNPLAQAGELGGVCINGQYCNRLTVCKNNYCQCDRGFMPSYDNRYCERLPKLGERCENLFTCEGDFVSCSCEQYPNCVCKCLESSGYFAVNGLCVRKNVALDEACTENVDCQAAYSECATSKCACKTDFTKATDVCTPSAQNCPIEIPFKQDTTVFVCTLTAKTPATYYDQASDKNDDTTVKTKSRRKRQTVPSISGPGCIPPVQYDDNCPDGYYCVPETDASLTGFCCKHQVPKCPVGEIHSSSVAPSFGCTSCPTDTHYCHMDEYSNSYEICCPKACYAAGDIISSGKCYARVQYYQECQVNEQCVSAVGYSSATTNLQCLQFGSVKKCACQTGYVYLNNQCIRVYCPFGGDALKDSNSYTMRCTNSYQYNTGISQQQQCPYGYECNQQYSVCCVSQCPPNMTPAVGQTCNYDYECYRGNYQTNNRYICNSVTRSCCNIQRYSHRQARKVFDVIRNSTDDNHKDYDKANDLIIN